MIDRQKILGNSGIIAFEMFNLLHSDLVPKSLAARLQTKRSIPNLQVSNEELSNLMRLAVKNIENFLDFLDMLGLKLDKWLNPEELLPTSEIAIVNLQGESDEQAASSDDS